MPRFPQWSALLHWYVTHQLAPLIFDYDCQTFYISDFAIIYTKQRHVWSFYLTKRIICVIIVMREAGDESWWHANCLLLLLPNTIYDIFYKCCSKTRVNHGWWSCRYSKTNNGNANEVSAAIVSNRDVAVDRARSAIVLTFPSPNQTLKITKRWGTGRCNEPAEWAHANDHQWINFWWDGGFVKGLDAAAKCRPFNWTCATKSQTGLWWLW